MVSMVNVPEGAFTMGCSETGSCMTGGLDRPAHSVWVSAFSIDKTEVTRGAYRQGAGSAAAPGSGSDDLPITGISWSEARKYCESVGKRLPTEAEWEKAARGTDERRYPWGDDAPRCDLANFEPCGAALRPVGSLPAGKSPYGALDMAGNADEWVSDWFAADYYAGAPPRDPRGPNAKAEHVVRGGSYLDDAWHSGAAVRSWDSGTPTRERGFRCVR